MAGRKDIDDSARRLERERAHKAEYYRANREVFLAKSIAYGKANREKKREYDATRYREERAQIRAAAALRYLRNAEKIKAAASRWHKANPDKARTYLAKRRALKAAAQIGDRESLVKIAKWCRTAPSIRCYWCGKETKRKQRHLDHIIPLIKGGAEAIGNLCVACPTCNCRKNDKMPEEFSGQGELKLA